MIARGCSVAETAEHICRHAERLAPGVICSVVRIDHEGIIHPLAGLNVPAVYSAALDGLAIGPSVGSCGTAAHFRVPVAVSDIFTDPLWREYQYFADLLFSAKGIKACWSSPILQSDGRVLGAFGFYYRENRGPTNEEKTLVAECIDLCALALEREEVRAENHRLAYSDILTGLGNRASFMKTLEERAESGGEAFAILLLDIDHLERFNQALGHEAGDRLIREVGETFAQISAPAKVFRIDADEFALLIDEGDAELALSRISSTALETIPKLSQRSGSSSLPLSISCGGALSDQPARCDVPALLQRANLALHHAKQTARGTFVLYHEGISSTIAHEFRVLQTLTSALAEDRVEAHYQPIVNLDTHEIVGLEALCRIRTQSGQIIQAGQFAEALQSLSMGNFLTDRMLKLVAADLRWWLDDGVPLRYVSVNISMADFGKGSLRDRVAEAFALQCVPLEHVVLEVTESVYMGESDHRVAEEIEKLRADGLLVALDDFGTGYASLTHLLNFPVDIIKIDKSFVDRMSDGGSGEIIIKALIDMADGLGMRIVAEGVETTDQATRLQRLGCRLAQGYLFGYPADREKTTEILRLGTPQ
ncbi:bifunctional diguanylate cyclase/phosphodiesterase [Silvibacterium acidisoli]|uniref:bifunctional diguanylate cyclase/phosphodiesterase n=1 Tax=Acidobacteriaceae bacterium ZG23-2 TaxID=2883246 RepID=UPI00406D1B8D